MGNDSDVPPLNRIARFDGDFHRNEPEAVVHFDDYDVSHLHFSRALFGVFRDLWPQILPQGHCDPKDHLSTKNGGSRYADESFHFILLIRQRREELSRQPARSQRGEPSRQWNRCAASCFHPDLRQRKRPAAY